MSAIKWPTTAAEHADLKAKQLLNRASCKRSSAESWMCEKLLATGLKWTRQAQWGYRFFDFWCSVIGVAIEVDGPEHRRQWDNERDTYNYQVSGILVMRVRNFNEADACAALDAISQAESWNERRQALGLKAVHGGSRS